MRKIRRGILVIQSMGIGDSLFALPSLRALKQTYPEDSIIIVTNSQNEDLFRLVPEVEQVISYRSKNPIALMKLINEVRRHSYRMAIVLNPVFRGALLARLSGAPVRIGYLCDYERRQTMRGYERLLLTHAYEPREEKVHEVERYLDLLKMFGLIVHDRRMIPQLVLTEQARSSGASAAKNLNGSYGPVVAINPGAGWEMRQWPRERFPVIADWLIERFCAQVVFVGGHREVKLIENIRNRMAHASISYAGKTSLSMLAGVLTRSDLFLTNDTGALHIAAALDVPTVALFGPGDLVKVRPLSPRVRVLRHQVPCSPCQAQYTNKCKDNLCMQKITIDEVKAAIDDVFGAAK